jgi:hypothetical protein
VAHSPFSSDDNTATSIQSNSGIWSNSIPQIVIFFLLALQSDIFSWDQYEKALGYLSVLKQQGRFRELERRDRENQRLALRVVAWLEKRLDRQKTLEVLEVSSVEGTSAIDLFLTKLWGKAPTDDKTAAGGILPAAVFAQDAPQWIRSGSVMLRGAWPTYANEPRLLALSEDTLYVYPDDNSLNLNVLEKGMPDVEPLSVFKVSNIFSVKESGKGASMFKLVTATSKVWFTAASDEECEQWVEGLQYRMDIASGRVSASAEEEVMSEDSEGTLEEEEEQPWYMEAWNHFASETVPGVVVYLCEYLEMHDEYYNPDTLGDDGKLVNKSELQSKDTQANLLLRFAVAVQAALMSFSGTACYALLVLNHAINGGVVSMILPILSFLWALSSRPSPPQWWWHIIILYTLLVISVQYVIKLPAFCGLSYMYGIKGHCSGLSDASTIYLTTPYVLGIRSGDSFLSIAWVDIAILVAVGGHIKKLQYSGRWDDGRSRDSEDPFSGEDETFLTKLHVDLPPGATTEDYDAAVRGLNSSDNYANMFFADSLALLWTLFYYPDMVRGGVSIQESLNSNNLDWAFVVMLMAQFFVLVLDRVLYLTRWNWGKSYLQFLQVIVYHGVLLYVFQMQSGNESIRMFYLLKAVYFGISATQIKDQYPLYTQGEYLTRTEEGHDPSLFQYYLYNVYRACPFLFELRVLLDWACCRTSLDFYQWFKLEDIFGQLFITKCLIVQRHAQVKVGGGQTWATKIVVGVGTFVALCLLLWAPLILFSSGSALMVPNPVVAASLHVSLSDGLRNFRIYSVDSGLAREMTVNDLDVMDRQHLIEPYFEKTGTQIIRFPKTSDSVFTAPPPLVNDLISRLTNPNRTISFHIQTVWQRAAPLDNKEVSLSTVTELTTQKKGELATVMNTVMSSQSSISASFSVNHLVPDVFHLAATALPDVIGPYRHNLLFTYHNMQVAGTFEQWWEIQYVAPQKAPAPIEIFAVSAQVLGSYMGIGSYISQLGVVGFYVSVVFVVGRLLRGFVSNLQSRVMFEDMEDTSVPLYLCESIRLARQEAGTTLDDTDVYSVSKALTLEDRLYWELIRLYRQPEKLFRYTTIKVAPTEPRDSTSS